MRESEMIAKKIYEHEHDDWKKLAAWRRDEFECRKQGKHKSIYISDDIEIQISDDWMCWYVWKRFKDQARPFYKVVKVEMLSNISIEAMLDAQIWSCI